MGYFLVPIQRRSVARELYIQHVRRGYSRVLLWPCLRKIHYNQPRSGNDIYGSSLQKPGTDEFS